MTSVVKPFSPKMLITFSCSCLLRYICLLGTVRNYRADLAWEKHHLVRHCTQAWFCEVSIHDKTIILCKMRIQLFLLAWNIKRFWDFGAYSCKGPYSGSEDHITSSVFNSLYFSVFWLNERQCIKTEIRATLKLCYSFSYTICWIFFELYHLWVQEIKVSLKVPIVALWFPHMPWIVSVCPAE